MSLRVSAWMRHRKLGLAGTAVIVGVIAGLAMGIVAGTRRTDSAPDRYTEHAGGDPDLTITQMFGDPLIESVRKLPGVISTKGIVFVPSFIVSPTDGAPLFDPNPFAGNDDVLGARVVEGRFTDPARPNEFTANRLLARLIDERFGLGVGDQFDVVSFSQDQVESNFDPTVVPAVPAFRATFVGITESPSDFDEPSLQMVFSASFLDAHRDVGVVQTIMASKLADGADSRELLDAVRRLPNGDGAYAVPTRVVSDSARRAVRFQVTALWLVSAVAMLAAAVVIAQMVGRTVRVSDDERHAMLALGWRRSDHANECAIEGGILVLVAAPVAALVAYAFSPLFPLGVLGTFEPDPGRRSDWLVAVAGVAGLAAVVTLSAVIVGTHRPHEVAAQDDVGRLAGVLSMWGAGMPLTVGARFARSNSRGRRSWISPVAGTFGVAALVGAVLVGVTLTTIVDRPERWGVNYDQLFGNPYTSADRDIVAPFLDNPDVVAVTGANFGSVTINGSDTATIGFAGAKGGLFPTVVDGRDPLTAGEIGIGAEVARRLDVSVGDTVDAVGSSGESHPLTVVGLVVTAPSAGDGAAMTFEGYRALNPEATQNVVLVNFTDDAPATAIDEAATANYSPPGSISTPTSVRALERVTAAPFLFAIVMALLLIIGSTYVAASSARSRRRDLAVLRALGSNPRQIRAVVHWQASIVALTIAVIGVPVGLVVGFSIVRLLTDTLGIVPGSNNPGVIIIGAAVMALLVANMLAFVTARAAARNRIVQLSVDR